jgi:hypothetical protein
MRGSRGLKLTHAMTSAETLPWRAVQILRQHLFGPTPGAGVQQVAQAVAE